MSYEAPISIYPITSAFNGVAKQAAQEMDELVVSSVLQVGVKVDKAEMLRALQYDRHQYEEGARDKFLEMLKLGYTLPESGHWKRRGQEIYCSNCQACGGYTAFGASSFSRFCPNCGAKMNAEEETNEPVT